LTTGSDSEEQARKKLVQGLSILERLGIVDFNGHVSQRGANGSLLINSGNSVRSRLATADLVATDLRGAADPGQAAPPAELPLHLAIYNRRPDVGAIVHGHPKWSTLLSSTGTQYEVTFAQGALLGQVPVFLSPRSVNNAETAAEVADALGDGHAVLLRAHGSVVAARNLQEAVVLAIYLEMNAERQVAATALGGAYVFSPGEVEACRRALSKPALFEKCWNYYLHKFDLLP
jgi:L-fuculose-phosphate aldolase